MNLPRYYQRLAIQLKNELVAESERSNWDRRNTSTGEMYCVHGCYLGTWDGPDYMCGACEEGMTHYEVALGRAYDIWRRDRERIGHAIRELLTYPIEQDVPNAGQTLTSGEYMTLMAASLFLTNDLKRGISTIDQALEALR